MTYDPIPLEAIRAKERAAEERILRRKYGETDEERDERFREGNDRIWGEGNWVRCDICPRDAQGRMVYHHVKAHE